MTKRFRYVREKQEETTSSEPAAEPVSQQAVSLSQIDAESLKSVPRRQGRTDQKAQLNVRIPKELKRLALAQSALEGKSIGELVEELLIHHLSATSNQERRSK